jgi:simple sugar transport system ATP-binding protein
MPDQLPRLSVRGVSKAYPGVQALDSVDFDLGPGEIHALLGENGAGKSTLIGVMTGVVSPDAGEIRLDGEAVRPSNPADAARIGISAVFQETNLPTNLSVAEALFLGREPTRFGLVQRARMKAEARALLARFRLDIDVGRSLRDYSTAVQQLVAIARAVQLSAKVLILDEPTASLDAAETRLLFEVMRELSADGLGIVFVTHFLDQVFSVCDRLSVLRNGRAVGSRAVAEVSRLELVGLMLGKAPAATSHLRRRSAGAPGEVVAEFRHIGKRRMVPPFDLVLRRGEIVGVAGLLGSGRTETALLMYGAERPDSGEIRIDGTRVRLRGPHDSVRHGLALCPENRKDDGILGALSVRENIAIALQARQGWLKPIPRTRRQAIADDYIQRLGIRTPDADRPIEQLSGGNQQKAILARWLATNPRLLIVDEPTRGIDVGAHAEIVALLESLCDQGLAIYVVSSELEEVAAYSDRVVVMRERRVEGTLEGADITPERLLAAIAGVA